MVGAVTLPAARYETDEDRIQFFDEMRARLAAIPGVEGVATASVLPLTGSGNDTYIGVPGRFELGTEQQLNAQFRFVSDGFFDVMGISVLRGRPFGGTDRVDGPQVVIVNQPFADVAFPDEDPIGQRIQVDFTDAYDAEIVGVVEPVNNWTLRGVPGPAIYLPHQQFPGQVGVGVILRTSVDPTTILPHVGPAVAELDPLQPVQDLATYRAVVDQGVAQPRFQALLIGLFAAVALVLAVVGVYGVLSYQVAQRAREVGIRIALGASRVDVVRLVIRRGLWLTTAGLAIGVLGAIGLTRYMASLLYGVGATDPATFVGVAGLLAVTSLAASFIPARRAARVDPTVTLRQE